MGSRAKYYGKWDEFAKKSEEDMLEEEEEAIRPALTFLQENGMSMALGRFLLAERLEEATLTHLWDHDNTRNMWSQKLVISETGNVCSANEVAWALSGKPGEGILDLIHNRWQYKTPRS